MISIQALSKKIEDKLNNGQDLYNFWLVTDTAKFKKPTRNKNEITEYVNGLFSVNGSDVSTLNNGNLVSTLNCTLKIIMRMKGYEEDILTTPEKEGEEPQLIAYGDLSRIQIMRSYLDNAFQGNDYDTMFDEKDAEKEYIVSAVYDFAQSGIRGQVEKIGNSYTFTTNIYYVIVQQGINSRSAQFRLDNVIIPYQAFTCYRTPTMDGNVYANSADGSTKNLTSQTTFSISFELPALDDAVTSNMFDFMNNGRMNQAHFFTQEINGKKTHRLVAYGEIKLIGQTIENLGQTLSIVECPTEYDLLEFRDEYFIYEVVDDALSLSVEQGEAYLFGNEYNGFIDTSNYLYKGDIVVSLKELNASGLQKVQ